MAKIRLSFKELVNKNRELIIKDSKLQDKIQDKIDAKIAQLSK